MPFSTNYSGSETVGYSLVFCQTGLSNGQEDA